MSTFGGKLEEIPDISVDRFDNDNLESLAYFLSHCHSDHMVGLDRKFFQDSILKEDKFIYTSDVSSVILKKMFPLIQNNIIILDIYKPTVIMLRDKAISVTPIPAGHCPGSVMFLFEYGSLVLYTGDYRIHKNDIRRVKSFYNSMNEIKKIEKVYLDTTFFLKQYYSFPKREDSLNEICKVIKEWIVKSNDHVVHLITSAKYGYEYVFNEIYKKIGMPVHVNYDVYHVYSIIPEMDNSVTVNDALTQIHSNCGYKYQTVCFNCYGKEIKQIKISAFRWTQDDLENGLSSIVSNIHYICYSTHASYEEGAELIKLLKPKSIEACVKHDDAYINVEMMQLLDRCLMEFKREEKKEDRPKFFTINSVNVLKDESNSSCSPLDNDLLNSPPRENIGDLRRFLKKHSSSFVLDEKCESLKIEEELKAIQEEFDFEHEFGIDEPCSSKTVKNIHVEAGGSQTSTVMFASKFSKELLKLCDVESKENTADKHTDNVEKLLLGIERDAFSEWFNNASPDKNVELEDGNTRISNTSTNVAKDNIENILLVHTPSNASSSPCSNVNENIENDTDLLSEIYFLEPSPPCNTKANVETKTGGDSNSHKGNGDGIVPNSWVSDLTPKNETENKLTLDTSASKVRDFENEGCASVSDQPHKEHVENFVEFLFDTFSTTSGTDMDLPLGSKNVESDRNEMNITDCPPRKKLR